MGEMLLPPPGLDLYELLGVGEEASEKELKGAFRRRALTCHPDKNPQNPAAAQRFLRLSQALAVLTDADARAAYDQARRARKQAARRTHSLDATRKRLKLDLEARERPAQAAGGSPQEQESRREGEVLRLRQEGSRLLQQQQQLIQEQVRRPREQPRPGSQEEGTPKLRLRWKCKEGEEAGGGGYSKEALLQILQKYGQVLHLVLSAKKPGRALVEFASVEAAQRAAKNEAGLTNNPLQICWLEGQPRKSTAFSDGSSQPPMSQGALISERDYESLVMMRMRQAAERQKLIQQLKQGEESCA